MMVSALAVAFLLTYTTGLVVRSPLPTPWSDPETCGSWHQTNQFLCDPDGTLTYEDRWEMGELYTHCHQGSGLHHLNITVFIATNLIFLAETYTIVQNGSTNINNATNSSNYATITTTTSTKMENATENGHEGREDLERLQGLVVKSYGLAGLTAILITATKEPFQVSVWTGSGLDLDASDTQAAVQSALQLATDDHHLSSTLLHILNNICVKLRTQSDAILSLHYIALTVTWIVFSLAFIAGLVLVAFCMTRAWKERIQRSAVAQLRAAVGDDDDSTTSRSSYPSRHQITSQPPNDLAVLYKSTGHVLLGTTDIIAVAPHQCASTDNLLEV